MLEALGELIGGIVEGIFQLTAGAFSKEGRSFLRDVSAILTGGKVKNRRRDGPVC
jgi:hypothetical protein